MTPDPSREIEQVIEEMREGATGDGYGSIKASGGDIRKWADRLALLTAASPVSPDFRPWVQHKPDCERRRGSRIVYPEPVTMPSIVDLVKMEQGRLAKGLPDANLQRTSSRQSRCTCGLDAALATSPVSPDVSQATAPQEPEWDEPHTGDDPLLDALTEVRVALEEAEENDEASLDDAIADALEALTRADEIRVAELKARGQGR